jgi:hypothetical protein
MTTIAAFIATIGHTPWTRLYAVSISDETSERARSTTIRLCRIDTMRRMHPTHPSTSVAIPVRAAPVISTHATCVGLYFDSTLCSIAETALYAISETMVNTAAPAQSPA